jgi:hypothetical protein
VTRPKDESTSASSFHGGVYQSRAAAVGNATIGSDWLRVIQQNVAPTYYRIWLETFSFPATKQGHLCGRVVSYSKRICQKCDTTLKRMKSLQLMFLSEWDPAESERSDAALSVTRDQTWSAIETMVKILQAHMDLDALIGS